MQNFLAELSDLGIVLALICVPLGTGAIFIPLGRVIAERFRATGNLFGLGATLHLNREVLARFNGIEATVVELAAAIERNADQQRMLIATLREQGRIDPARGADPSEGRITTPH